jgi:hypothetical protein
VIEDLGGSAYHKSLHIFAMLSAVSMLKAQASAVQQGADRKDMVSPGCVVNLN